MIRIKIFFEDRTFKYSKENFENFQDAIAFCNWRLSVDKLVDCKYVTALAPTFDDFSNSSEDFISLKNSKKSVK